MGTSVINRLQPDTQVDNLNLYKDDILEADLANAESLGIRITSPVTSGVVAAGLLGEFKDTTLTPFSGAHENYFIVVSGSSLGNNGSYQITDITSTSIVKVKPSFAAAETGLTYSIFRNPSMEDDVNYVISQLANIIGNPGTGKKWNSVLPRGFDPANTSAGNAKNEIIDLSTLATDWYGSKTKILRNQVVLGQAIAVSNTGKLILSSRAYATPANRTGGTSGAFPIFKSVANAGSYFDENGINGVCKVNVLDSATGDEFYNAAGYLVFGKLEDGADYSGTGAGTDVYVRFYQDDGTNGGKGSVYTWAATDPTNVYFELPVRKRRRDILEHEEFSQFATTTLGDAESALDIAQIRDALGLADGEDAGDWDLTNTGNYFPFSELNLSTANIEDIVNKLNEEIGNRTYTQQNLVVNGETITASINKLDMFVGQGGYKTKIIERVTADITKNTAHAIPFATGSDPAIAAYRIDSLNLGRYMDVYVGGQKLIPHVSAASPGQYIEIGSGSGTTIAFKFDVKKNQAIEYKVIDDTP